MYSTTYLWWEHKWVSISWTFVKCQSLLIEDQAVERIRQWQRRTVWLMDYRWRGDLRVLWIILMLSVWRILKKRQKKSGEKGYKMVGAMHCLPKNPFVFFPHGSNQYITLVRLYTPTHHPIFQRLIRTHPRKKTTFVAKWNFFLFIFTHFPLWVHVCLYIYRQTYTNLPIQLIKEFILLFIVLNWNLIKGCKNITFFLNKLIKSLVINLN